MLNPVFVYLKTVKHDLLLNIHAVHVDAWVEEWSGIEGLMVNEWSSSDHFLFPMNQPFVIDSGKNLGNVITLTSWKMGCIMLKLVK